jgi:hypothetical protein
MELRVWRPVKDVRFHSGTLSHYLGDNPVMALRNYRTDHRQPHR